MKSIFSRTLVTIVVLSIILSGCQKMNEQGEKPRLSLFVGMDISGSFMNSGYFDNGIDFVAHYLYAHLNGLGGLEKPNVLFVGSIGGAAEGEAKTFYPVQTFANMPIEAIAARLREVFPKESLNVFTDYNAFFEKVARTVKDKNLLMRPISIVLISDGVPDVNSETVTDIRSIHVQPLERLARSVTIRLLYTNPVTGKEWQTKVKRQRVKIWTQDAEVMKAWQDSTLLVPGKPFAEQSMFFDWVKDNVDFGVRGSRVR